MSVKGGSLIVVAGQVVLDRAQSAGPATVNLNRTKVYELGNYLSVGSVVDLPDTSWSLESFDVSSEFEAVLAGKSFYAANATQVITITGGPTGGTFTATLAGSTTSALAYNIAASALQTAINALTSMSGSTATVTGSAGGPYTVTYTGAIGSTGTVALMTFTPSFTGGSSPAIAAVGSSSIVMAAQTALKPSAFYPINVACEFKAGASAASPFNTVGSAGIPHLTLESLTYRFGLADNATQSATLRGDAVYYNPGSTYLEEFVGTNTANQVVNLANVAGPYTGDTVAGTKYALDVSLLSGQRLTYGSDYTEAPSGGGQFKTVAITIIAPVATSDKIRVMYHSTVVAAYPQVSNAAVSATRPAALRGRNIGVFVGGHLLSNRWTSVQSAEVTWSVSLQRDEEFSNSQIVATDYDVPDVKGNIVLKPRDYAELYTKLRQIANVTTGEAVGPLTTTPLSLDIVLYSDVDGSTLKSLAVSDARFNLPGFSGRVNAKTEFTLDWLSDSGDLTVYHRGSF